ncbi:MAG: threonylcarbamoyl-AMP synthase [Candidatus Omnitrophota bacterium]|nr:MAG: threonylcarbamoyl-AMP synthase [Candidatus Omnitrophota bacterium]HDM08630.1 threonylcarbamoyl-AMP synthase [Candidatus Omnitrophota bacterium]
MKTEYLKISPLHPQEERIKLAVEVLRNGGLVVLPTETVYGIGFDPDSEIAWRKIERVKSQRGRKPYSLNLAYPEWVKRFNIKSDSLNRLELIRDLIPGPVTFIVVDNEDRKIGFRIPDHLVCRSVIQGFSGPVYLPSANPSGLSPACSAQEAMDMLWGMVDMVIDSGPAQLCVPSAVVDLTAGSIKLLREGPPFVTAEITRRIKGC